MEKKIGIIGAGISIASGNKGASMGPDAIRIGGLYSGLERLQISYKDRGNLSALEEPHPPRKIPVGDIRYLDLICDFMKDLKQEVTSSLEDGEIPLVLGGDHSLAMASLAAVINFYKKENITPGVIWFDAHADLNTEETSPSGNIHGMPLAVALGDGNDSLKSLFEGSFLDPSKVVLLGVRSVDSQEAQMIRKLGVHIFTMKDIDELGMKECVSRSIAIANKDNSPVHVSFDIDGIDGRFVQGTGTPVNGGITLREAHLFLEMLAAKEIVTSVDLVEVNPLLDDRNKTAEIAVHLIESLFGRVIY
ncbi:MAG: arginase [Candidatus Cloacimonadota bacterium]|nr:MAG: arginase [Candidatus Cloacimonadota bacterium]